MFIVILYLLSTGVAYSLIKRRLTSVYPDWEMSDILMAGMMALVWPFILVVMLPAVVSFFVEVIPRLAVAAEKKKREQTLKSKLGELDRRLQRLEGHQILDASAEDDINVLRQELNALSQMSLDS